jgi:hypothetical protein
MRVWTGFIWLGIGTSGGLFWNTIMSRRVVKKAGNFLTSRASQEGVAKIHRVTVGVTENV